MKKYNILLAIIALVLASLACQTIMGGGDVPNVPAVNGEGESTALPTTTTPTDTTSGDGITVGGESPFPVTSDAFNMVSTSESVTFQTKLSSDDVMKFYRDEFGRQGLTEDASLSVVFGSTFTITFTGHENGRNIYVVGADAGDGSIYVTIAFG